MDALFGLPRKKAAGVSHRDPLHGEIFFCEQSLVDQFVEDSSRTKGAASNVVSSMQVEGYVQCMHSIARGSTATCCSNNLL